MKMKWFYRTICLCQVVLMTLSFFPGYSYSLDKEKKVVIAHRGVSGYLPEHTLEGVAMAHGLKVDYIEPDVVLSKDNIPIILHDLYLETTTNVKELYPLRARADGRWYAMDFTLAEIKALNVHERTHTGTQERVFKNRFPLKLGQFKVPTLKEFIELVQGLNASTKRKVGIYLELKAPELHAKEDKDLPVLVLDLLNSYNLSTRDSGVIIQCFHAETLKRLKNELKTSLPLIQLIGSPQEYGPMVTKEGLKKLAQYADGIGPEITYLFAGININRQSRPFPISPLVKLAHENNLMVHPYTVRMESLPPFAKGMADFLQILYFELGVDGLFTDFPDLAVEFLREKTP